MTRFSSDDHTYALVACFDASDFLAIVTDADLLTLNRAAASFAMNEPENLTRGAFCDALARVRQAIDLAKISNPEHASKVIEERQAKAIAHAAAENEKRLVEGRARKAASEKINKMRSNAAIAAGESLRLADRPRYEEILDCIRAELDAMPPNSRPKNTGAVGSTLI